MNAETQAVLFSAVPSLISAALSLAVGVGIGYFLWRDRARATGLARPPATSDLVSGSFRGDCSNASAPSDVATQLLDELAEVFELDLANMALIEDEGRVAVIVAARENGEDHTGLVGQRIALEREPSGISAAVREGMAFTVYDAEHSAVVNQRLNAIAKAKSCVSSRFEPGTT